MVLSSFTRMEGLGREVTSRRLWSSWSSFDDDHSPRLTQDEFGLIPEIALVDLGHFPRFIRG
jgi:hypothetical protein